jgi:carbamoyltransferase
VVDGMGETGAAALFAFEGGRLRELKRHRGRGSVGFFFGLVTDLAGFDQAAGEEWKIMGLAPYGRPDPDLMSLLRRLYRIDGHRVSLRGRGDDPGGRDRASEAAPSRSGGRGLGRPLALRPGCVRGDDGGLSGRGEGAVGVTQPGACRRVRAQLVVQREDRRPARFSALHVPCAPADDGNAVGAAWLALSEDNRTGGPRPGRRRPISAQVSRRSRSSA